MNEKELISKIRQLKEIKPRESWVVFTKNQILGGYYKKQTFLQEVKEGLGIILRQFQYKPAFAALVVFGVFISTFGLAQGSLPGDALYPLKKLTEKTQAFLSRKDQSQMVFQVANSRLDDLTTVAQSNLSKNLAPAIKEYKESVSQVAKNLTQNKGKATKEVLAQVQQLEEKKDKIESLGVKIDDGKELDDAISQLVGEEIKDLKTRTLSEGQQQTLSDIKADYEKGSFNQALEKILLINAQ